jgi:hypothetical protein
MASLKGHVVQIVRGPLARLGDVDLVVITEQPYTDRPAPWMAFPTMAYELHWPDGSTTWHLRHEFEPIGA